ncbi:hypothetical protein O3M35_003511 [Rhynocoris fuscipes]|uniref:ferroxidase n=1 Tax=Rhynocoris fuscipes TaxID=488301 RepID=A0AAW1CNA6_9HEMI
MLPIFLRNLVKYQYVRCEYLLLKRTVSTIYNHAITIESRPINKLYLQTYSTQSTNIHNELTTNEFERICEETLESLCETLEILIEKYPELKGCDITFGDGVLTVSLGNHGTYVINRQTPNKQIWLSSPKSGPKRYDYFIDKKTWIYKHDNVALHTLLQNELSLIFNDNVDLSKCSYSFCK